MSSGDSLFFEVSLSILTALILLGNSTILKILVAAARALPISGPNA
jgi:hypothetical protein